MRYLVLVLLVGCGQVANPEAVNNDTGCPQPFFGSSGDEVLGSPCTSTSLCFVENTFSSCTSAFYRCVDGAWQVDRHLAVVSGGSCADSPLSSCEFEGNTGCDQAPTAEWCSCDADGTWHCTCACDDPLRAPTCH